MLAARPVAFLAPLLASQVGALPDWTIGAGQTVEFNAGPGLVEFQNLTIEAGGRLRFVGRDPVNLRVHGRLRVDGTLDNSGFGFANGFGVLTFNTTSQQEPGLVGGGGGGAGGGAGGTGNLVNFDSSPLGGDTRGSSGGRGGESAFAALPAGLRRAGGGGGGVFAAALPLVHPDPFHPSSNGRVARAGSDGSAGASSAVSLIFPPLGGASGTGPFLDGNPANDSFGQRIDPITQLLVTGELAAPRGGSGGGSGGMFMLSARRVDLSAASAGCLSALGGDGGRGADNQTAGIGGGGDGGPGLIQMHLANGLQDVVLPVGKTLADLSVPEAYVLLPLPGS